MGWHRKCLNCLRLDLSIYHTLCIHPIPFHSKKAEGKTFGPLLELLVLFEVKFINELCILSMDIKNVNHCCALDESSLIKLSEECHTTLDPVWLGVERGQVHLHHKVGRVAGGGEDASPVAGLVHGAKIVWERFELGDLIGYHPNGRSRCEKDLLLRLPERMSFVVVACTFQEESFHIDPNLRLGSDACLVIACMHSV